jgi:site-specific recombinase XerD
MTEADKIPAGIFAAYEAWLARQPLAVNTRRTYRSRVKQYCDYLLTAGYDDGDPLTEGHARDYAVRDYKVYLKTVRKAKPASINLTLAAVDHFYRFLGLNQPMVKREDLPAAAPRALEPEEQKRFLRTIERCPHARDRSLALLLFYTGLRISECTALNADDILLSARKGKVIVRMGKGGGYREVALNVDVRTALDVWLHERTAAGEARGQCALFLSRQGQRLSTRAVDLIIRRLGTQAGLVLSAHTLRHTCLTNLVRNGNDLMLVAEIAGHKRLETTRRYSLPSARDWEAAMEGLRVEY